MCDKMKFLLLIMFSLLTGLETKKPSKALYFTSAQADFNPTYLQDHRLIPNKTKLDVILNVAQDFPRDPWVIVIISSRQLKANSYRTLVQYDINVCNVLGKEGGNFVSQWVQNFMKYGNMPKSCPIKKGNFSWHDLRAEKISIPDFFPASQYKANIDTYLRKGAVREYVANLTIFIELK